MCLSDVHVSVRNALRISSHRCKPQCRNALRRLMISVQRCNVHGRGGRGAPCSPCSNAQSWPEFPAVWFWFRGFTVPANTCVSLAVHATANLQEMPCPCHGNFIQFASHGKNGQFSSLLPLQLLVEVHKDGLSATFSLLSHTDDLLILMTRHPWCSFMHVSLHSVQCLAPHSELHACARLFAAGPCAHHACSS